MRQGSIIHTHIYIYIYGGGASRHSGSEAWDGDGGLWGCVGAGRASRLFRPVASGWHRSSPSTRSPKRRRLATTTAVRTRRTARKRAQSARRRRAWRAATLAPRPILLQVASAYYPSPPAPLGLITSLAHYGKILLYITIYYNIIYYDMASGTRAHALAQA